MSKRRLGKGLEALISDSISAPDLVMLPVDDIEPNPSQPRAHPDRDIQGLADSIKNLGVLQPIDVRETQGGYQLVAGERRLRAARLAGLEKVPAVVVEADDAASLQMALVENIQREQLNPVEEARAIRSLSEDFSLTHEEIGSLLGMDRATVTNKLRLLNLSDPVLRMLEKGLITEGHARALLSVKEPDRQLQLANMAASGASVRQIEAMARAGKKTPAKPDPAQEQYQELILRNTGLRSRVKIGRKKIVVSLEFSSSHELEEFFGLPQQEDSP